jgi:hypothetical protein
VQRIGDVGISAETRGCYSGESCAMRFWTGGVLWRGLCRKDQEGRMQFLCGRRGRVWSDCRGTGLPLMSCLRTDQSAGAVSSEVDSNHRAGLGWRDSDALQANPSVLRAEGTGRRPTIQLGICLRRGHGLRYRLDTPVVPPADHGGMELAELKLTLLHTPSLPLR